MEGTLIARSSKIQVLTKFHLSWQMFYHNVGYLMTKMMETWTKEKEMKLSRLYIFRTYNLKKEIKFKILNVPFLRAQV